MDGSVVMGPSTSPDRTRTRKVEIKSVNLALQGGGAHGAFTWGFSTACSRTAVSGLTASAQRAPAP
jgi:hypothetical protein